MVFNFSQSGCEVTEKMKHIRSRKSITCFELNKIKPGQQHALFSVICQATRECELSAIKNNLPKHFQHLQLKLLF